MRYAQYDSRTGAILRTGSCQLSDLGKQARSFRPTIVIPSGMGSVDDTTHKIVGHPENPTIVPIED